MTDHVAEMILAEVRQMRATLERLAGERLNIQQAAEMLSVSRATVTRMEADGRIPQRGRDGKWTRSDLQTASDQ
jgi:predicted DNA-binding transcriptional regulator AlpA